MLLSNDAAASGGKTQERKFQNAKSRQNKRQTRLCQLVFVQYAARKYSEHGLTHINIAC